MAIHGKEIKIFSGNANIEIAQKIADKLEVPLGKSKVSSFADGETAVHIKETVRGADVFVVQPTSKPVNDSLMELLIMIDAFKRASANRITAVIPYYGYARQDRKSRARDPISAKLVADLITTAGADRVLTMDLHTDQLQGFFDIPVDHLLGAPVLLKYFLEFFNEREKANVTIVSPDLGSVGRTRSFAEKFNAPLAIIDKRRPHANQSEVVHIIGDVRDKTVLLVDDIIDTAGTLCNAAKALVEIGGAKRVFAAATHAVFSHPALENIANSPIEQVVVLDTIKLTDEALNMPKIKRLSASAVFANAIERIYEDRPVSPLFDVLD